MDELSKPQTTDNCDKMFGPLTFEETKDTLVVPDPTVETKCLLCEGTFNLIIGFEIFVQHLFQVHNLVVEEIQNIKDLPGYVQYWRDRFRDEPIEEIVPAVRIEDSDQKYFILSDLLKDDRDLRFKLKLKYTLEVQEFERTDLNYEHTCFICNQSFKGSRPDFITHLSSQHNFQLGNPQNMVFLEDLIEKIETQFIQLKCLFCDRTFPERNVLKEHMRKKLHKRINPRNKEYDKYFIANYLKPEKKTQEHKEEAFQCAEDENADDEYADWNEAENQVVCLLCDLKETNINTLCLHMEADHEFDFVEITKDLDFYQKIKLINYIRKQIHSNKCLYCEEQFDGKKLLQYHLLTMQHYKIPEIKIFDQPEYYFPTYENDAFLYLIDDVED